MTRTIGFWRAEPSAPHIGRRDDVKILSDNETRLDLLNNRAIAKTIASIVLKTDESVTIGVHGSWGAGKSSVLAMVEDELDPEGLSVRLVDDWDDGEEEEWKDCPIGPKGKEGVIVVRFNTWQYQGFEDAKIALMSAIVSALENRTKAFYKQHRVVGGLKRLKEVAGRLWKNLDKLSVAKRAVGLGVTLTTGTAPLAVATTLAGTLRDGLSDPDAMAQLVDKVSALTQADGTESMGYSEMESFRADFKDLLEESHAKELVVLIDDLDRCLPKVAIETLEAIRLFLALENTAFVIAADGAMIRYFVREYFPSAPDGEATEESGDVSQRYRRFSDKYLEKLIQVPFYIPRIGVAEAQLYVDILLVESGLGEGEDLDKVVDIALSKLRRPWAMEQLTVSDIKSALGDEAYDRVVDRLGVAKSIDVILAKNTAGNSRDIKRFINTLLLRMEVARNSGFEESGIEMAVLAKMMLAEQYLGDFYKALAGKLDGSGLCSALGSHDRESDSEDEAVTTEGKVEDKDGGSTSKKRASSSDVPDSTANSKFEKMLQREEVKAWLGIEPALAGKDLRPYYFLCQEKIDPFYAGTDERIRELAARVCGGRFARTAKRTEIEDLASEDAKRLFHIVSDTAFSSELGSAKPSLAIDGLRFVVKLRPELRETLAEFLLTLPAKKLGMWAAGGWESCIPTDSTFRSRLEEFLLKVEGENEDPLIIAAAKKARLG